MLHTSKAVLLAVLCAGCSVLVVGMSRGDTALANYWELIESEKVLKETLNQIEEENIKLQEEIQKIKFSSEYAKKVLRDKYHILEQNERIVFFESEG